MATEFIRNDVPNAVAGPSAWRCRFFQHVDALIFRHLNRGRLTPQSPGWWRSGIVGKIRAVKPDIVHLHWISGAMCSFVELAEIPFPTVWTLHDSWGYCATEHYHDRGDERFISGYDCAVVPPNGNFLQRRIWTAKQQAWRQWKPVLVGPSNWIAGEAMRSKLFHELPIQVIPNCVDCSLFRPGDRGAAREKWGIRPDAKVVVFSAFRADDRNKGGDELTMALRLLARRIPKLVLLALGHDAPLPDFGIPVVFTGMLRRESEMAAAYTAGDAAVLASKYDNLPNILIEALACGLPCAAFAIGGIPEIISDREDGALAEPGNPEALAGALEWILTHPEPERLRRTAVNHAREKFNMRRCGEAYRELYRSLLKE